MNAQLKLLSYLGYLSALFTIRMTILNVGELVITPWASPHTSLVCVY